jgi:hypothetical protein
MIMGRRPFSVQGQEVIALRSRKVYLLIMLGNGLGQDYALGQNCELQNAPSRR